MISIFISRTGVRISKIAIVAERRWEPLALAFAGAGVRHASEVFPPDELEPGAKLVGRIRPR